MLLFLNPCGSPHGTVTVTLHPGTYFGLSLPSASEILPNPQGHASDNPPPIHHSPLLPPLSPPTLLMSSTLCTLNSVSPGT